jgi:hypothetical protein
LLFESEVPDVASQQVTPEPEETPASCQTVLFANETPDFSSPITNEDTTSTENTSSE